MACCYNSSCTLTRDALGFAQSEPPRRRRRHAQLAVFTRRFLDILPRLTPIAKDLLRIPREASFLRTVAVPCLRYIDKRVPQRFGYTNMAMPARPSSPRGVIPGLRWWIAGLLFASTVINYIDRQTLNVLAPYLKAEYRWSNSDFALVVIAFRSAYAVVQLIGGRLVDVLGTRRGLGLAVAWYSVMAMLTSLAGGLRGFCAARFLLGAGEAANWPGATKAVSEWFPARERGIAVALFDSGSAIGAAVAPVLVVWLFHAFGTWRGAFLITGALGLLWLIPWSFLYERPEDHPRISESERAMILQTRSGADQPSARKSAGLGELVRYRQTWGVVLVKAILDPYWFLVADWFALFLTSRGFKLEETLAGFWVPFLCADLGNFVGGGLSSYLLHRGWTVGAARRIIFVICGPLMLLLLPAVYTTGLWVLITEFGLATLGYAACATIFLTLPTDLFESRSVATVSGLAGMVTGLVTIAATHTIGAVTDTYSFAPVLMGASAAPVLAAIVVFALVRNTRHTGNGVLLPI
jgi:ACS family hexuronate transporter-like MFS transporter